MTPLRWCTPALVALACLPRVAAAHSTPRSYQGDPVEGGAGGRFFSGARGDRYTCEVCHQGADAPAVGVSGLPVDGAVPGSVYELSIHVVGRDGGVGMVAEIADAGGFAAGLLEPALAQHSNGGDVCASGLPATRLYNETGRNVAAMSSCGADRM